MNSSHPTRLIFPATLFVLAALLLAACGSTPTATAAIVATAVPQATATPQPLLMLVAPPAADADLAATAAEIAGSYAADHQLQFIQTQQVDTNQMPGALVKLVVLAPDPGAGAYAAAAPQAQVITVGFIPQEQAANLVALPLSGESGSAAFVAGYIAGLTADDWRVGMLYTSASENLVQDFVGGARYYCGACIPEAPPVADFPLAIQSDIQNWQGSADMLLAVQTQVVYLPPEMQDSGAAQYLANLGVLVIGNEAPSEGLGDAWLASVGADAAAALRQQLPLALDGQAPASASSVSVSNANPGLLSQARLDDVQAVIDDLATGYIVPPSQE